MSLRRSPRRTPALLAANRLNALRSTGPRTPDGKRRSALNALRHGRRAEALMAFLAQAVAESDSPGTSPAPPPGPVSPIGPPARPAAELLGLYGALHAALLPDPQNDRQMRHLRRATVCLWTAREHVARLAASPRRRRARAARSVFRSDRFKRVPGTALSITDNAPGSPQTASLTGTGTAVKLAPTSLSFGSVTVGTTSNPRTVTLRNASLNSALNISSFAFSGFNTGAFAETNTCGTSVPPRGSCLISVTFTPKAKGGENANLNIFDNGGASPQIVILSGFGK